MIYYHLKFFRNTNDMVDSTERFFSYSPVFIHSNPSIFMCVNISGFNVFGNVQKYLLKSFSKMNL